MSTELLKSMNQPNRIDKENEMLVPLSRLELQLIEWLAYFDRLGPEDLDFRLGLIRKTSDLVLEKRSWEELVELIREAKEAWGSA